MKRTFICSMLFAMCKLALYSQNFEMQVPNTNFIAEAGTGIDTKLKVVFNGSFNDPVYLSANTPQGIGAILQPDTITSTDSIVLSVFVTDTLLGGQNVPIDIKATDNITSEIHTINLHVIEGDNCYMDDSLGKTYRDSAIIFITAKYPEILDDYGDLSDFDWSGFFPYPPWDVVVHFAYLFENWRINVLWHVYIPPYDWKKVFVYNEMENVGWGINIDTDGMCTEIPCEKFYYFYQDTNSITNIGKVNYHLSSSKNYPNPFKLKTTITFPNPQNESYTLDLYSSDGHLLKTYRNIRQDRFEVFIGNLLPGVYFYQLAGSREFYGKMIIE